MMGKRINIVAVRLLQVIKLFLLNYHGDGHENKNSACHKCNVITHLYCDQYITDRLVGYCSFNELLIFIINENQTCRLFIFKHRKHRIFFNITAS